MIDTLYKIGNVAQLGEAVTLASGSTFKCPNSYPVRIKAIGESSLKLKSSPRDAVVFSDGETEYMTLPEGKEIVIITGKFNIMF